MEFLTVGRETSIGRLANKVAVITGAASGIGRATARLFVVEGARVVLADLQWEPSEVLAAELGANALFLEHDVSSTDSWRNVIDEAEHAFGPVSVLVNNAGIICPERPIDQIAEAEYRAVIEVNQIGVFLGMKSVIPSMRRAGRGAIVNLSLILGLVGAPNLTAYAASKFAVAGMTKTAAMDLGKEHIRVNAIHPGIVRTPLLDVAGAERRAQCEAFATMLPLGRLAEPEEVAAAVLFMASDDASHCTGVSLAVDAGWTAA
ncbi:MAG: glucose 1-dehydrogenase [Pseudomonadota bacterium]|nr:glucose 1-dehydrogenase [Pseudomonadota bacterium]